MSDVISRADAICEVLVNDGIDNIVDRIKALPSADAEFADMPDIPRYYYEKVVGNMAHEINMLKEQLESAVSREFYEDAVKANIRILMENRELKEQIESAKETIEIKPMEIKVDFHIDDIDENRRSIFEDIVWIVRCKDCRHRDLFSCPLADNDFQKDDDFCSWGERRDK